MHMRYTDRNWSPTKSTENHVNGFITFYENNMDRPGLLQRLLR